MESRFGKSIGITKVKHLKLGDVAYKDVYFVRYKVIALRFIFIYYKNENGLLMNSFKFDENFEEEF
ncbi:hypothetical protein [Psychroserpens sp. Hel_I_66]|uniref:hypothetical protein n=1 Tax=Psychroserpens sp. Hel_I_66 TaxID=1250004 RepID=UPI0006483AC1|nr:hypothetical protein [Psychroserpens sp. Hel_I_66]